GLDVLRVGEPADGPEGPEGRHGLARIAGTSPATRREDGERKKKRCPLEGEGDEASRRHEPTRTHFWFLADRQPWYLVSLRSNPGAARRHGERPAARRLNDPAKSASPKPKGKTTLATLDIGMVRTGCETTGGAAKTSGPASVAVWPCSRDVTDHESQTVAVVPRGGARSQRG